MNIKLLTSAVFGFSALGGGVAGCCYYFKSETSENAHKDNSNSSSEGNSNNQIDTSREGQQVSSAPQSPSLGAAPAGGPAPAELTPSPQPSVPVGQNPSNTLTPSSVASETSGPSVSD